MNYGKTARLAGTAAALLLAAVSGTSACSSKSVAVKTVGYAEPVIEAPVESATIALYDYVPPKNGITGKAEMLTRKNKDIVGWLKIFNTKVDYPVFKDPGEVWEDEPYYGNKYHEPNSFYLERDMNGEFFRAGSLFMDYRDDFGADEDEQSENIVIYGHNMANNTMFGSIRRYRQDYGFFEQAPFVEFSSNYCDYDYVICGCIITGGSWFSDFLYWNMEELDSKEDFDYYINCMRAKQLFETGVDVRYGDKLLTLSTCYADEDNSRFLVIARRLREGEVMGDLSTIERTEEYKKAHQPTEPPADKDQQN